MYICMDITDQQRMSLVYIYKIQEQQILLEVAQNITCLSMNDGDKLHNGLSARTCFLYIHLYTYYKSAKNVILYIYMYSIF